MDRTIDLNDLRYFALIVDHGGFSAAERVTEITKSKLSRRMALLEERLGVRLLQRSTRRLALTEAGRAFYDHCVAMLVEAEAATAAVEQMRSEPAGLVRITAPLSLTHLYVARMVGEFMRMHPKVRVEFEATDRVVNLIEEKVDLAIRAIGSEELDPGLSSRRLATGRLIVAASATYLAGRPPIDDPQDFARHDTIGHLGSGHEQAWTLIAADGRSTKVTVRPRLLCSDYSVSFQAVMGGAGIALVPLRLAWSALNEGTLVRVAKDWSTPELGLHVVFPSRRGMLPSVRTLIDYLAKQVPLALGN